MKVEEHTEEESEARPTDKEEARPGKIKSKSLLPMTLKSKDRY